MGAENGRREKRKKKERKMKKRGREWTKREGGEALDSCRFESAEGKLGRWRGKFTATSIKTVNFPGPTRNIRRRVIDTVSIGVPGKRHDPSREARQRRCAASARRGIGERGQRAACCKKFALESKFNLDHPPRVHPRNYASLIRARLSIPPPLPVSSSVSSIPFPCNSLPRAISSTSRDRPVSQRHNCAVSHQRIDPSLLSIRRLITVYS